MKRARELPPSIPASILTLALVGASCGGAAVSLCGAYLVVHPEAGASIELARALIYAGLLWAVAAAVGASQPWGPRR